MDDGDGYDDDVHDDLYRWMDGLDQRGVPEQAQVQRNDKQSETRKQKEKTKLEKEKRKNWPKQTQDWARMGTEDWGKKQPIKSGFELRNG